MLIDQISDTRTVQLTLPELQLSLSALRPETAVVTLLSTSSQRMRTPAHLRHPMTNRINWRRMGEGCVQGTKAAGVTQGGRNAGYGAYDVTDSKFSTSMGPPPVVRRCSWHRQPLGPWLPEPGSTAFVFPGQIRGPEARHLMIRKVGRHV